MGGFHTGLSHPVSGWDHIAAMIAGHRETVRIVTLAGPSSAGKTTMVRRLSLQLKVAGIAAVAAWYGRVVIRIELDGRL